MYRIVNYIKRPKFKNWEGILLEDMTSGKQYISNGYYLWKATDKRLDDCIVVKSIDMGKFMARWNCKFFRGELLSA